MLSGPPGAGKTRTALIVATELAGDGKILVVDTERESALTYADDFDFVHLPWYPPYTPNDLTGLIREASGQYTVIIIDSFSHFWRGEGGVLDVAGGKFTGWKEARPMHEAMLQAILDCDAHVILGVRSKIEYVQEVENGRHVVRKLGLADQQDDNLSFEMNVALDLAMDHVATVSKSRTTALPVGRSYGPDKHVEMAGTYREWLKGGEQPVSHEVADAILGRLNSLQGEQYRRHCKARFAAAFGRPEQLRDSALDAANGMLVEFEAAQQPDPDDTEPSEGPVPDLGVPGEESVAPVIQTAQEPASQDEPEPAPATRRKRSPGEQLHRQLGGMGITRQADQEAVILNVSNGRTHHASELTENELASAHQWGKWVESGQVRMEDILAAADEHARRIMDEQLEASVKQSKKAS